MSNWKERLSEIAEARKKRGAPELTAYLASAIAEGFCEGEGASKLDQLEAWQYLHDTGIAYELQGWYGRTAQALLEQGFIER